MRVKQAEVIRALRPLIEAAAKANSLPADLVAAIVTVESGGNPAATRFEEGFLRRYIAKFKYPAQEARERSTSWGLMQIMGQTAYEMGFRGKFPDLLNPRVGLEWGCIYLRRLSCRYEHEPWEVVCRAYNGGPGERHNLKNKYPDDVIKHLGGVWPPRESTVCAK